MKKSVQLRAKLESLQKERREISSRYQGIYGGRGCYLIQQNDRQTQAVKRALKRELEREREAEEGQEPFKPPSYSDKN